MPTYTLDFQLPSGSRDFKRRALIEKFMLEFPGTGNGENASRFHYNVELYGDYAIFLKRPTRLNKGFDFTVNISGLWFKKNRRYSNPSHSDIANSLQNCKDTFPDEYIKVKAAIIEIYNCNDTSLSHINADFRDYEGTEHPIQIILLAIKWLFMEQDCAYWNYSGRRMFFDSLSESNLV